MKSTFEEDFTKLVEVYGVEDVNAAVQILLHEEDSKNDNVEQR